MSAPEREIGELAEAVRGMREDLADLRKVNSEEHASNAARMVRIEEKLQKGLERKADRAVVEDQGKQIAALTSSQDRRIGRDGLLKGAFGACIALATLFIANGGHLSL